MQKLLDREMPLPERRSRRLGWWWVMLGLTVGLASGALAVRHFSQPVPPAELPQAAPDVPIAATRPAVGEPSGTWKDLPATEAGQSATIPATGAAIAAAPQPAYPGMGKKTPQTAATLNQITAPLPLADKTPLDAATLFSTKKEDKTPTNGDAAQPTSPQDALSYFENEETVTPESGLAERSDKPLAIGQLDGMPLQPLALPELPLPTATTEAALPRGNSSLMAYVGGISDGNALAGGGSVGLLKSATLKNPKFSLEGGVGYAYVQQPLSVIFTSGEVSISSGAFNNFNAQIGDARFNSNDRSSAPSAKLRKTLQLHYLELPFAVRYRIAPRLSVRGGLTTALLLFSDSDYTTGGLVTKLTDKANESLIGTPNETSFEYSGDPSTIRLNPFDVSATLGIDYHLGPRTSLGIGYQAGILDLIPGNNHSDFNRFFRAALRYRLGG